VPGHAVHCRLSSLPHIFGTTPDTIPAKVPYLFAEPDRIAFWRERLEFHPAARAENGSAWLDRPGRPTPTTAAGPYACPGCCR